MSEAKKERKSRRPDSGNFDRPLDLEKRWPRVCSVWNPTNAYRAPVSAKLHFRWTNSRDRSDGCNLDREDEDRWGLPVPVRASSHAGAIWEVLKQSEALECEGSSRTLGARISVMRAHSGMSIMLEVSIAPTEVPGGHFWCPSLRHDW